MALAAVSACKPSQGAEAGLESPEQRASIGFERIFGTSEELSPPNDRQISGLEQALRAVNDAPPDTRHSIALKGLMAAAAGRIPLQLARDLHAYSYAEAGERASTLSAAINNNIWLFDEVCGRSFAEVTETSFSLGSRVEVNRYIWRECGFDRYPLLNGESEYVEVSDRVGLEPMIAYFIYGYLDERGGAHPLESRLLREIAQG